MTYVTINEALRILQCDQEQLFFLATSLNLKRKRIQKQPTPIYGFKREDIENLQEKP